MTPRKKRCLSTSLGDWGEGGGGKGERLNSSVWSFSGQRCHNRQIPSPLRKKGPLFISCLASPPILCSERSESEFFLKKRITFVGSTETYSEWQPCPFIPNALIISQRRLSSFLFLPAVVSSSSSLSHTAKEASIHKAPLHRRIT